MDNQGIRGRGAIRVQIQGRGPGGWNYGMSLEEDAEAEPGDAVQDEGDFKVLVGPDTLDNLRGATIDFVGQLMGGGFKIENPNPDWSDPLAQGVQELIDSQINPGVASHGGHVELLDVKENKVYVRMGGGCQGCGMASVRSEEHTSELQSRQYLVCRLLLEKKKKTSYNEPNNEDLRNLLLEEGTVRRPRRTIVGVGGGSTRW